MENKPKVQLSDHLANERTFLAWIRTAIAIMGFGFVVVKFSIFIKQVSVALGTSQPLKSPGHSHTIGILLVGLGALTVFFSVIRYQKAADALKEGIQYQSSVMIKGLATLIFLISLFLLIYLLQST